MADADTFQYLAPDADLIDRIGRERNAQRVADARPQQHPDPDRRFHRPADQPTRLGDPQVQRIIAGVGPPLIGGDRKKHVRCLPPALESTEIAFLKTLDLIDTPAYQRPAPGPPVF